MILATIGKLVKGAGVYAAQSPASGCTAHEQSPAGLPERLVLGQAAAVLQPLRRDPARRGQGVDADPSPAEALGRLQRRAAAAKGVQHDVVPVAAGLDDPLQQGQGFLRWIAESFRVFLLQMADVPHVAGDYRFVVVIAICLAGAADRAQTRPAASVSFFRLFHFRRTVPQASQRLRGMDACWPLKTCLWASAAGE